MPITGTLAQLIRWNTGIVNIQDNVFFDRSVIVFEAPDDGANVSLLAGLGVVTIIDNDTGHVRALRSLDSVSQVILVGSNASADVFNIFLAAANGGIEDGVIVYGGSSAGDVLNVYGLPVIGDTFNVTDGSFEIKSMPVNRSRVITQPVRALLRRRSQRSVEWKALVEKLPPLGTVLVLDLEKFSAASASLSEDELSTVQLVDGRRAIFEIIDDSGRDAVEVLREIDRLISRGLVSADADAPGGVGYGAPARRIGSERPDGHENENEDENDPSGRP